MSAAAIYFVVDCVGADGAAAAELAGLLLGAGAELWPVDPLIPGKGAPPVGIGKTTSWVGVGLGRTFGPPVEGLGCGIWLVAGCGIGPLVVALPGVGTGPAPSAILNSNCDKDELDVVGAGLEAAGIACVVAGIGAAAATAIADPVFFETVAAGGGTAVIGEPCPGMPVMFWRVSVPSTVT